MCDVEDVILTCITLYYIIVNYISLQYVALNYTKLISHNL